MHQNPPSGKYVSMSRPESCRTSAPGCLQLHACAVPQYLGTKTLGDLRQKLLIGEGDDMAPMWSLTCELKKKVSTHTLLNVPQV